MNSFEKPQQEQKQGPESGSLMEKLKQKVFPRLKSFRTYAMAGLIAAGAVEAHEGGTALKRAIDYSKDYKGSTFEKALITPTAAYFGLIGENVEDIQDALHEMGIIEDEVGEGKEVIAITESTTLQKLAEDRVKEKYLRLHKSDPYNVGDGKTLDDMQNSVRQMSAHWVARHWSRINNLKPDQTIEPGTQITIDQEGIPTPENLR